MGVNTRDTLLFALFIIILSSSKRAFWWIALPFVSLYALYLPIGINFGPPSFKYFASVLATDPTETKEFIALIPIRYYFYPLGIVGALILYRYLTVKFDLRFYANRTLLIVMVAFSLFSQSPFHYPKAVYESITKVSDELRRMREVGDENAWLVSEANPRYKNYVLIIGESARRDYHHAYGYPIENTPFMSSAKGVLVEGLTSGGINTVDSLRLMLTKPDTEAWEVNYPLNFVDLAKKAEMRVTWISNHGYYGKHDTPVTTIANRSDRRRFLKVGGFGSGSIDDRELLPFFKEELQKEETGPHLIVLHIYGSHPNTCERLHGFEPEITVQDPLYKYLACYVTSIHKTDALLEEVNMILEERYQSIGESYSMLYFADHGLAQRRVDQHINLDNSAPVKPHYEIPLFKVSSDDTERVVIKRQKSGLRFTEGLATWMGIESPLLPDRYDLFSDEDDKNDFGLGEILKELPDDPAIDIRGL